MSEKLFDYYRVDFKLLRPQLGTATRVSIYAVHVLEKAKKEIAKANRLKEKTTKALDKYKGSEILPDKELRELQGVMRAYMAALGRGEDIPNTVPAILEAIEPLEDAWHEKLKKHEVMDATVFLRNKDGKPIIGTHMILGNLKENAKIMVNGKDKSLLPSKVSVGETFALDVKAVDSFMIPDQEVLTARSKEDADGIISTLPDMGSGKWVYENETGRILIERPIKFERMGKVETAIAISEALPIGTEYSTVLRVRANSQINEEALVTLFSFGKSNGLGAWRGSGNAGAYCFKLEKLKDYSEKLPEGWI